MQFSQENTQAKIQNNCSFCKAPNSVIMDYKQGTIVCTNCGFINKERIIDYSAEWNNFQDDGIDEFPFGKQGKQYKFLLKQCQSFTQKLNYTVSKSSQIISSLKKWGERFDQSQQVICDSINIYKTLSKKLEIKGKNNFYIAIGILVTQSRISNSNVLSIETIAQKSGKNPSKISRAVKFINELQASNEKKIISNANLVNEMAQKLKLSIFINIQGQKIADKIIQLGLLEGKNPKTIAMVAIYIACKLTKNEEKSLSDLQSITGIAKATIQKSYKIVYEYFDDIVHSWEGRLPIKFLPSQAY